MARFGLNRVWHAFLIRIFIFLSDYQTTGINRNLFLLSRPIRKGPIGLEGSRRGRDFEASKFDRRRNHEGEVVGMSEFLEKKFLVEKKILEFGRNGWNLVGMGGILGIWSDWSDFARICRNLL